MKKEEKVKETKNIKKAGKTKWLLACEVLILLAIAVVIVVVWRSRTDETAESESAAENELQEELSDDIEQYLTINLFPGFSGEEADTVIEGALSNSNILLEYAGSCDGIFYEDGQNQEKEQVFSLILTNVAEDTLEVMQLWIEDENGESYQFQVSALPTGGAVLAQELSGKEFRKDGKYKIVRDNFGFLASDAGVADLEIQEVDDKIYVTNTGGEPMESVQLLYKNWLGGYAYPGGIAYRIGLESIGAGETLEITAEHYKAGESRVTGIKQSIQPEGGTDGEADGESADESAN